MLKWVVFVVRGKKTGVKSNNIGTVLSLQKRNQINEDRNILSDIQHNKKIENNKIDIKIKSVTTAVEALRRNIRNHTPDPDLEDAQRQILLSALSSLKEP